MKITLVGCGNMGLIYARAFLKYAVVSEDELLLVEKNESRVEELMKMNLGRVVTPDNPEISQSDLLLLAVKPQDFPSLASVLKHQLKPEISVISIMAGVTLSHLEEQLQHATLIRAMPNSPAGLGMGVTAMIAHSSVSSAHIRKAEQVLSTTGRTVFLDQESQMDAVTALSGSGPAYFFYLVKHMIEAGKAMGLDDSISAMLVKQTMLGAFHLINQADQSLDNLIKTVASKGGTTEAAFKVFDARALGQSLQDAILAAEKRAGELSKS